MASPSTAPGMRTSVARACRAMVAAPPRHVLPRHVRAEDADPAAAHAKSWSAGRRRPCARRSGSPRR
eukprot:1313994-Pyramimonas_sp.AAC.1